jgi:hypothetical protein
VGNLACLAWETICSCSPFYIVLRLFDVYWTSVSTLINGKKRNLVYRRLWAVFQAVLSSYCISVLSGKSYLLNSEVDWQESLRVGYTLYRQLPPCNPNQENELTDCVVVMEKRFFGLALNELPGLAFMLTETLNTPELTM